MYRSIWVDRRVVLDLRTHGSSGSENSRWTTVILTGILTLPVHSTGYTSNQVLLPQTKYSTTLDHHIPAVDIPLSLLHNPPIPLKYNIPAVLHLDQLDAAQKQLADQQQVFKLSTLDESNEQRTKFLEPSI